MKTNEWFKGLLESVKDNFEFRLETLILKITEKICVNMKLKNINRTELAGRLNVSSPAVTKILNGNSNFTLKTLLSLADALDLELDVNFKEKSEFVTIQESSYTGYFSPADEFHLYDASYTSDSSIISVSKMPPTTMAGLESEGILKAKVLPMPMAA